SQVVQNSGLKSRTFITAGERSVACGQRNVQVPPAQMGRTITTEAFCPFGQVPRFRKIRRQRYRSPAVTKIKPIRAKKMSSTLNSHNS
ncbi:MAG: hypothetical protein LBG92_10345, partial [Prevotellaceae bacterium]|nr:hypothetical protein [Prevotellaceae bacterium]